MSFVTEKLLHFVELNLILFALFRRKLWVGHCWAHLRPQVRWIIFQCRSSRRFFLCWRCLFDFEKNFANELTAMIAILYYKWSGYNMLLLKDWSSTCSSTRRFRRFLKELLRIMIFIYVHHRFVILNRHRSFVGGTLTASSWLDCVIIGFPIVLGIVHCSLKSTTLFFSVVWHFFFKLLEINLAVS